MYKERIRIGTMVRVDDKTVSYVKQIMPHGFESISLSFGRSVMGLDLSSLAGELRDVLSEYDGVISSVCVYGNPLHNDQNAQETRNSFEQLIDNAHLFGCDIVGGFAGRVIDVPIDQSIDRYAEVFAPLAKRAEDKGVRLAFENCDMGGTWARGDWNIAQTPMAWELMFNALPADNIGLQWEPCHQVVKLIDPMPQLRKWTKKIFHVHGKDATILWDVVREHGIYGPAQFAFHRSPGFGDSNWIDIISELRRGGFEGCIDIEGWHDPVYNRDLEMMGQVHGLNYLKNCRGGDFVPNPI